MPTLSPHLRITLDPPGLDPGTWGFSRPEYWSGLPFPSPGGLPHPGMEPKSPALQADSLPSEPSEEVFFPP